MLAIDFARRPYNTVRLTTAPHCDVIAAVFNVPAKAKQLACTIVATE